MKVEAKERRVNKNSNILVTEKVEGRQNALSQLQNRQLRVRRGCPESVSRNVMLRDSENAVEML
jgi:hypothetical protein